MNITPGSILVLLLAAAVLWLCQKAFTRVVRPHTPGMTLLQLLLLLFAWSFVLGVVMRWVRLSC